jgi:hypothetical protein
MPSLYGKPAWTHATLWQNSCAYIHYVDGTKEKVGLPDTNDLVAKVEWERVPEWRNRIVDPEGRKALGLDT